jgi:peptidase E
MIMELHLFSSPGENDIRYVIEASRPYLESRSEATVAFVPLASFYSERWLEDNQKSFKDLAQLELIDTEKMTLPEMEDVIRRASLVYISGGNTFLLNHRLQVNKLMPYLRKKVQAGLPVVAFSAGTVLCGPNILTSKDMNTVETPYFTGLNILPFNFLVHYAQDAYGQSVHDEWLSEYHDFHENPVIMMSDGAYIRANGRKNILVRGDAWILRKGREKEKIEPGKPLSI